jgi:uncharacterized cupredoxin-like copper-binding protein
MKFKLVMSAVCALLSLSFLALPARAADGKTTINIALLDMSAVAGNGMMGQGWGGGAGPGWGGMMGQGWNGGNGPGPGGGRMMGPGWGGGNGPGWGGGMMGQGYGMMGMGMMSIRTDKASVKAGEIHFAATNWSRGVIHEMLVIAVDNPNAPLPYDYNAGTVPEKQVKVLGEVPELQPNASGGLDLKLAPGSYLLLCNVPGHYAAGMVTPLTVTP